MESAQKPGLALLSDRELLDRLKHEASAWFNNQSLLLLEELFRRYEHAKSLQAPK